MIWKHDMNEFTPVKEAIKNATALWEQYLSATYLLHLELSHHEPEQHSDNYLFGPCIDWGRSGSIMFHRNATIADAVAAIEGAYLADSNKSATCVNIELLSNDLNYSISHRLDSEDVSFNLWSSIFGKGRYYGYVIAQKKANDLWLLSSTFARSSIYHGFEGSLEECAQRVFLGENELPHPYEEMITLHPSTYEQALASPRTFL